jgi:hypothetical protein
MRPTWKDLAAAIREVPDDSLTIWNQISGEISPEEAFLLILALTGNDPTLRNVLLRKNFGRLEAFKCNEILKVLLFFSPEEVKNNLAPLLHSGGMIARRAAYLLARLTLTLNVQAFPLLLTGHDWDDDGLHNLAFLVEPRQKTEVRDGLAVESPPPGRGRVQVDLFLKALDNVDFAEPKNPDDSPVPPPIEMKKELPGSSREKDPSVSGPDVEPLSGPPMTGKTARADAPPGKTAIGEPRKEQEQIAIDPLDLQDLIPEKPLSTPPLSVSSSGRRGDAREKGSPPPLKKDPWDGLFRKIFWGGFSAALVVAVVLPFLSLTTEDGATPSVSSAARKAPDYWIDSVSQKAITQNFLQADNDYQMGELFVVRGQYDNALSLFRDALAREPGHALAQFREGFCLYQLGDYVGARKALERARTLDEGISLIHLFLARIAIKNRDVTEAVEQYKKEYEKSGDWRIGLEFAEYLVRLRRWPEARRVALELTRKHPGNYALSGVLAEVQKAEGRP